MKTLQRHLLTPPGPDVSPSWLDALAVDLAGLHGEVCIDVSELKDLVDSMRHTLARCDDAASETPDSGHAETQDDPVGLVSLAICLPLLRDNLGLPAEASIAEICRQFGEAADKAGWLRE